MKQKPNKDKIYYIILTIVTILIILGTLAIILIQNKTGENKEETELTYTELIRKISNDEVEKIEMTTGASSIKVTLRGEEEEKNVIVPNIQAFIELVQDKVDNNNIQIELTQKKQNPLISISTAFFSLLPTLLIVALFILILKKC